MRFAALVVSTGLAGLLMLHGCGLGIVGIGADDDASLGEAGSTPSSVDTKPTDASTNASDGNIIGTQDAAACGCALTPPSGWALVAYAGNRTAPCTGDLQAVDVVTDPDPTGACSCSCTTTPPTCNATTFTTMNDSSATAKCDTPSGNTHDANTSCGGDDGTLAAHAKVSAPAPQGGSCTATSVKAPPKSTAVRVCKATGTTCACDAGLGTAFTTCLAATGDMPCPASAPKKHLVAGSADVTCGGTCDCTLKKSCKATVTWFSGSNCTSPISTIDSESCGAEVEGADYHSLRYAVDPVASCTPTGTPTGTPTLPQPSTVCCP